MQRPCSLFQYLAFRPNVTFDEPATPDGKSWNAALKYISQTQGWSQLHWGARLDSKTVADLLIGMTLDVESEHGSSLLISLLQHGTPKTTSAASCRTNTNPSSPGLTTYSSTPAMRFHKSHHHICANLVRRVSNSAP